MDAYRTEILEQHGSRYQVEWIFDYDHGAPWEECDGHGIVSEWTSRNKHPGELILHNSRGKSRYYDFAATMKLAKKDGWGGGDTLQETVMNDFNYLRRWCRDLWHYCGIKVTKLDYDHPTEFSDALWGIEDDGHFTSGYHASIIQDMIGNIEYQESRKTYPVTHCGI